MIEIKPNEYNVKQCKYIGVNYNPKRNLFITRIRYDGKTHYIGFYETELEGALAYDLAVKENNLNKRLNFPEPEPENVIPNTRLIRLNKGLFAIVDESDFKDVSKYSWYADKSTNTYYAIKVVRKNGNRSVMSLHRYIMGITDPKIEIDHRDRNGLNCQRSNMRICTQKQNSFNQIGVSKTSLYKGVFIDKTKKKYIAQIKVNYKSTHIGTFTTEIEAAKAYDKAAKLHFKEFAYLNFPE